MCPLVRDMHAVNFWILDLNLFKFACLTAAELLSQPHGC